ncbi:MAG: tRNA (adenosine(37)-N6)-dimethylallyltransferase MiaA [Alphaproteobacteria bacterium]|nr:tRNA (adenosine(37)-N6)-dimethylallyltransferase MiaA [Alphaproteobacteria bacterium]
MKQNQVLIIAGPTASGKSALAVAAARALNGVIINCDSMQIYKDIPIIAATPSAEEKAAAEHRLFEMYDVTKRGNVVEWLELCVAEIKKLWAENRLPVVVGGTGMYIDALINGVTPIPEVNPEVRRNLQQRLHNEGLLKLYIELQQKDIEIAQKLSSNDKTRIVRALEIIATTGKKVSEWYQMPMLKKLPEANFTVVKIVPEIAVIEERCRSRLDKMVQEGALKEITELLKRGVDETLPAMKALGVPELSLAVKGEMLLSEALELAKLHTRQYAKRQRTWLKNKLPADIVFSDVYRGQPEFLEQIKEVYTD